MIATGVFFLIGPWFYRRPARADESARAPYPVEKSSLMLLSLPQRGVLKGEAPATRRPPGRVGGTLILA
jgi:hypothetical protein